MPNKLTADFEAGSSHLLLLDKRLKSLTTRRQAVLVQSTNKAAVVLYFEVPLMFHQQLGDTRVHHVVPGLLCDELTLRYVARLAWGGDLGWDAGTQPRKAGRL